MAETDPNMQNRQEFIEKLLKAHRIGDEGQNSVSFDPIENYGTFRFTEQLGQNTDQLYFAVRKDSD